MKHQNPKSFNTRNKIKEPNDHPHRTNRLIKLLQMYRTKKHIQMKPIMKSIYSNLMMNKPISYRQLECIIPYILRDLPDHTKQQVIDNFSCCVHNIETVSDFDYLEKYYPHLIEEELRIKNTDNSLEQFMV